jgi:predicted amino acid dehydrogenase
MNEQNINQIPKSLIKDELIISPELDIFGTKGYVIALKLLPKQIIHLPREKIKKKILEATIFAQNELDVSVIQLGALTTSVTSGGIWLVDQKEYTGYTTHGDSYTAAVTCQAAIKALNLTKKQSQELNLAIIGAYGVIGEAVSKILVPQFDHSILIGPRYEKLKELKTKIEGNFEITNNLKTKNADIIITATSHPKSLLNSEHLKENAIIIDVSQPPNLSLDVCKTRQDICRIDGGYVDFPKECPIQIPGMPIGKNFACISEAIMQAMEKEQKNHVGSIDLKHLQKTEKWGKKYGFTLNELTNFGQPINIIES